MVRPARPTIYNGIQMRSRLEAGFAAWLDQWGVYWQYEPLAFADEEGQYLPDFMLKDVPLGWFEDLCTVYIEVKPVMPKAGRESAAMHRAACLIDANTGCDLLLAVKDYHPQDDTPFFLVSPDGGMYRLRWVQLPNGIGFVEADIGDLPWPDGYWQREPMAQ